MREVLSRENIGEFSLQAQQGEVRAVFLPLNLVQRDLDVPSKVNAAIISGPGDIASLESLLRKHGTLQDLGLTLRELDILRLLPRGMTNREIATALFITERTAATHVQHIFAKLGVNSRAEAAALAVEHGLL